MQIAVLVPAIEGAGAEFVAREWSAYLVDAGHHVDIVVTHPSAADVPPPGAGYHVLPGSTFFGHVRALRRTIRARDCDAVVAMMPYWNLLALVALKLGPASRTRVLISGRTMAAPLAMTAGNKYRLKQLLAARLYRRADCFLAISTPVAAEALALYKLRPTQVCVIPNPATAKVLSANEAIGATPTAWHEEPEGTQPAPEPPERVAGPLVVPARLVNQKRPYLALAVAAELRRRHGTAPTVHFFGRGPLASAVEAAAHADSIRVVMHGYVENWFESCPAGSVVLLPSFVEGFGNVLVEAAAAGWPSVVSSRSLGVVDAVIDGVTGQISTTDSAHDLADAVDRARQMTFLAPAAWLSRFSPSASGRALEIAVRNVL